MRREAAYIGDRPQCFSHLRSNLCGVQMRPGMSAMRRDFRYSDGVVTIRPPTLDDLDAHLAIIDEEVMNWLWERGDREAWKSLDPAQQREHQRRYIQEITEGFGSGPKWCFSGCIAEDHYVVYVDCDLANLKVPGGEANISYACHPAHRGNGYTSRAVRLICDFLRQNTHAGTGHLMVDPANEPSLGLARAVGATRVGDFVDESGDTYSRLTIGL